MFPFSLSFYYYGGQRECVRLLRWLFGDHRTVPAYLIASCQIWKKLSFLGLPFPRYISEGRVSEEGRSLVSWMLSVLSLFRSDHGMAPSLWSWQRLEKLLTRYVCTLYAWLSAATHLDLIHRQYLLPTSDTKQRYYLIYSSAANFPNL